MPATKSATPVDLFDEVASRFPSLWPQMPQWQWVNIHDGKAPLVEVIAALVAQHVASGRVVVLVRSEPGVAVSLPIEAAADYIAPHVLKHEIQVSDPLFTRFLSVSKAGVATGDA